MLSSARAHTRVKNEVIEVLSGKDANTILEVINEAARVYQGAIPDDCYNEPYMSEEELHQEMRGMIFFGWRDKGKIVGVIGFQKAQDVTLTPHAYVLPECQSKGIGAKLLSHVQHLTKTKRLLVGTWADAAWAIDLYQKHGFIRMADKDRLLKKYWDIPQRQIGASVVMSIEI